LNLGNVLIFGGTGMLSMASGWIAENSNLTIAFGRNENRLQQLQRKFGVQNLKVQKLDYTDTKVLENTIKTITKKYSKIDLVVAWIHENTAPKAIPTIRKLISEINFNQKWSLLLIKGSSSDISRIIESEKNISDNCKLKVVQLGFIYTGTTSRWLTHEEISDGVIQAITYEKSKTIVGTLEPWDKRP